ncbi:MAG: LysE family translocator [Xanthobacteraceae bacterium]|nr:LysE family translocator [Xanthobacteraceae bacterium]
MSDMLLPLLLFAAVGSLTPGPNNVMVTASGTAFGFARTVPHMFGVTAGFGVMILAIGFGLAEVFRAYPELHGWLRLAGAAYLLYLAVRIARAGDPGASEGARRPLSFLEAALFQWVNAKAWTLALGVVTAFTTTGGNLTAELLVIAGAFMLTTFPSLAVWCLFGVAIRRFLASPRALRITNLVMAALVALSVVLLFV